MTAPRGGWCLDVGDPFGVRALHWFAELKSTPPALSVTAACRQKLPYRRSVRPGEERNARCPECERALRAMESAPTGGSR